MLLDTRCLEGVRGGGIRMLHELYKRLQGKAGPRQIKNPKLGLAHNLGGIVPYYNVIVYYREPELAA